MTRTMLAAGLTAALLAAPAAGACVAPKQPMPFDLWVYGPHPQILVHKDACVIDPYFYVYTPAPGIGGRNRAV